MPSRKYISARILSPKEKLDSFKRLGWKYNPDTGEFHSPRGKLWNKLSEKGYVVLKTTIKHGENYISIRVGLVDMRGI